MINIEDLKLKIFETVGDDLGKIIDKERNVYPGIQTGLEFNSDLEFRGVIAAVKPIENGDPTLNLNSRKTRGNIEVHFVLFDPGSENELVVIWEKLRNNFLRISHVFIDPLEQYGQTGKLVVYFGFDLHHH